MATITRMTAEEYYALDTGDRWTELVDGVVVVNEPKPIHAALDAALIGALYHWTKAQSGRGLVVTPVDVELTEYDVYGPDISWIAERNRPANLDERLARVPDLCIEIRSPSTWRFDVGRKKAMYESHGLPELWLVDTVAETVLVFRRSRAEAPSFDVALELSGDERLTSQQLPGFELIVADLFRL
jgi:Uma2 family endonuclease